MPMDEKEVYEWKTKVHAQYLSEYKEIDNKRFELINQINKSMTTLSAGTLTLSMTLVAEVFKSPKEIWLLAVSWLSFAVTILLLVLGSFLVSRALRKQLSILSTFYKGILASNLEDRSISDSNPEANPYNAWITFLNFFVPVIFIASYFFLGTFVLVNL